MSEEKAEARSAGERIAAALEDIAQALRGIEERLRKVDRPKSIDVHLGSQSGECHISVTMSYPSKLRIMSIM